MSANSLMDLRTDENGKERDFYISGYKDGTETALAFRNWFAARPAASQKHYTFKSRTPDAPDVTMFIVRDEEESRICKEFMERI